MSKTPLIPGTVVDGALCVSNSLLKDMATCETRAYLSWVLRKTLEGEVPALYLGSAVHLALATYFKGGTIKETMAVFKKAYKAWAVENIDPNDKWKARFAWDNTRKVLRYWLRAHPLDSLPFTVDPNLVEIAFATPLDDDATIILRGILDLLVRHRETHALLVNDHKTTGAINAFWASQFKLESQITGYMWGVGAQTDEPIEGGYINGLQFSLLPGMTNPHYKCRTHGVTYSECQALHVGGELLYVPRTAQQTAMWRTTAIGLAGAFKDIADVKREDVKGLRTEGMFNGSCRFCPFMDWCRNGREPGLIDTMLVDRPSEQEAYLD